MFKPTLDRVKKIVFESSDNKIEELKSSIESGWGKEGLEKLSKLSKKSTKSDFQVFCKFLREKNRKEYVELMIYWDIDNTGSSMPLEIASYFGIDSF